MDYLIPGSFLPQYQPLSPALEELAALGALDPDHAIRTNSGGDYVAETPSNFLAWLGGVSTTSLATALASYALISSMAPVATTGSYNDLTSKPTIPAAQVQSDWNAVSGLGAILNKPVLFNGTFAALTSKPTTLSGYGITDAYPLSGNPSGFVTGSSLTTTLGSYVTTSSLTSTLSSYATTSALTSGLAGKEPTITAGTNLQYWRGDKTWATFPTTVSTFTNDSGYITQAGARTSISLTTTGTSGASSYNNSTGVLNIPNYAVPAASVINQGVSRSLSNAAGSTNQFTISSTRNARVYYSIQFNFTVTALLGASATIFLEYSTNAGSSWLEVGRATNSFSLGLALAGSSDQGISGEIPANALVRLRPATTGGGSLSYIIGQEVLV